MKDNRNPDMLDEYDFSKGVRGKYASRYAAPKRSNTMDRKISTNVFVCFSPDENIYFLERREPGNWAVSNEDFENEAAAEQAFKDNMVKWVDD